eukprot:scaffold23233_cov111-Isochrysis_galbana.AAC.1
MGTAELFLFLKPGPPTRTVLFSASKMRVHVLHSSHNVRANNLKPVPRWTPRPPPSPVQVIFPPGTKHEQPLIVQKGDGGFGYDSTDMAAIWYRCLELQ